MSARLTTARWKSILLYRVPVSVRGVKCLFRASGFGETEVVLLGHGGEGIAIVYN